MSLLLHPSALRAPALVTAALVGLPLAACRTAADGPAGGETPAVLDASATDEPAPAPGDEAARDAAIDHIRSGDYAGARALLDDLLRARYVAEAEELLGEGTPEDALLRLDLALALDPRHAETRLLKADGSLQLAEKGIASGATAPLIEGSLQDALEYYGEAAAAALPAEDGSAAAPDERAVHAVFGACRAAFLLGDSEASVRWARVARTLLQDGAPGVDRIEPPAHRTIADALYGAYTGARVAGEAPEVVEPLFDEAQDAISMLLGRASDDAFVWARLADLYEWEERQGESRALLLSGLDRLPEDAGLQQRLARVARKEGGRPTVIASFERTTRTNPRIASGHWYLGYERFEHGVDLLLEGEYDADLFRAAEASFARSRELEPRNRAACLGYEVMCRNARGWCAYYQDDLETAVEEFLSMDELFERGIEWKLEGRMLSGVMGLAFVGDQYNNREDWLRAGEAFETAHHLEPGESAWANNAGFFLRDAAVELEAEGERLCQASKGAFKDAEVLAELRELAGVDPALAGTAGERARFAAAATERKLEARAIMERSWKAYEAAAALSADDVRTVNDAGLVLVYYLHTDLDAAEALLRRAIELGAEQVPALRARLEDETLEEAERQDLETELLDLEEAWGDAYQNLGVLEWLHQEDGAKALPLLERSVEIGPDPRPMLSNNLVLVIRGEREPPANDYFDLLGWGRPCE
jgi:tetratricopeptide (TPR) repeat protein